MDAAANTYIAAWKGCPVVKPAAIVPPAKAYSKNPVVTSAMDWWSPGMTTEPSSKRGRDDQYGRTLFSMR